MSNLDKVMSRLKSQKSKTDEVPELEEPNKKKSKKPVVKEPVVEEETVEEEDDDEEEDPDVEKEVTKEPLDTSKIQEQRVDEIQVLQNDGIFRVELLYQIQQINKNLINLNTLISHLIGDKDDKK